MTCADVLDRLDDYADGALAEAESQELELHLAGCKACRTEERALRALLAEAASLAREVVPPRDLWPGIAERIAPRKVVAFAPRRWSFGLSAALATAAAVAIAVSVTLLRPSGGPGPAATTATPLPASAGLEGVGLGQAEAEYLKATNELLAALDAGRETLAPETLQVVDQNLRIIDGALDQIRAALRKDPGNPALARMLRATHQRKIEVLRRLTKLKA